MSEPGNTPAGAGNPAAQLKGLLKGNALVPLILAGSAFAAAVVALVMWASAPEFRVLFSNLSEGDGGRIISELESRAVPYQIGSGGSAILVPSNQVHRLRLQLAEQGLPKGGNVGFELMDKQEFGISQFTEQVNFQRSLEGELARSITAMDPVVQARVHLSMAKPSVFIRDSEPAKASVVVTLHPGRTLNQGQVEAIVHLVSSSVPKLGADKVTVVDQTGKLLSANDQAQSVRTEHLSYIQAIEARYQRRVEDILKPLYGEKNVQVQVTASVDFAEREETQERFQPNQGANEAAVRSTQLSGSLNGSRDLASGIPGALSNTPPGWTASPINADEAPAQPADQATAQQGAAQNSSGQLSYDNVVNYEVDRNITHIRHAQGNILRLSVAAVINYRDAVNEDDEPIQVALPAEELEETRRLIIQAAGLLEARGDQLEVVNRPFSNDFFVETTEDEPEWWERPEIQQLILTLGRYLIVGIFGLLLYSLLLRPFIKRYLDSLPPPAAVAVATSAAAANRGTRSGTAINVEVEDDEEEGEGIAHRRVRRASTYERDLKGVRELAKDDPRIIAMVVRSWMNKDE